MGVGFSCDAWACDQSLEGKQMLFSKMESKVWANGVKTFLDRTHENVFEYIFSLEVITIFAAPLLIENKIIIHI